MGEDCPCTLGSKRKKKEKKRKEEKKRKHTHGLLGTGFDEVG